MEKAYTPKTLEPEIYQQWEASNAFKPTNLPGQKPFCIIMPPANVTGYLHLGHALTFTIQDILVRYHRMLGENVLWQPGTDHAGIATQVVVEKQLQAQGKTRHDLGRQAFLEKVWEWKDHSGGAIIQQLKALGASADWDRERFTMDDLSNQGVLKVFVELYRQGLIYRDKRLVNWDRTLQSAISDLEVEQRDVQGFFYFIAYPLVDQDGCIVIATTRPETLFGDVAVAVNPEDERYQDLIGQEVFLPLTQRRIPIIADDFCDPEKGTGAVKITPGHDFNDFEMGKRHNLRPLNILTPQGTLNDAVPEAFQGLTTEDARVKAEEMLLEAGLLLKKEPLSHTVPHSERSGTVVEPYLTDQWYLNAKHLAKEAIKAVEDKETCFLPEAWTQNYFEWMHKIEPWCVSRQLWWGHRIPAWFGPDQKIFVAYNEEEALEQALQHYGEPTALTQDPDVLDTWFSSALWPFTALDWPQENAQALQTFYPTSVLVTGFDIIFFWVARMMMMGLHFLKQVPFKDVYIHPLIRDAKGQKMSKSKGNVIDPLELIEDFGTDALRFTLARLATPGRDIKLGKEHVEIGRNFITKLWNAARYVLMQGAHFPKDFDPQGVKNIYNQWIIAEFQETLQKVTAAFQSYQINVIAQSLYHFTWGTYCDWYVEMTKPILMDASPDAIQETKDTLAWILAQLLKAFHPVIPFVTEEIWKHINPGAEHMLIQTPWPQMETTGFPEARQEIGWILDMITATRSLKAEFNIPAGAFLTLFTHRPSKKLQGLWDQSAQTLKRLGRIENIEEQETLTPAFLSSAIQMTVHQDTFFVPLGGLIDIEAEKQRLQKNIDKNFKEKEGILKRLADPQFTKKAPPAIIEESREQVEELEASLLRLTQSRDRLHALKGP